MGMINNIMKPSLVQRHTRIRLYKILARSVLCYGSEAWTLRKKDESRITANEMKFMRYTAGYTKWDHKRNEDVMEELQLEPVINHVKHYRNNWINHLQRMRRDRIPKVMLHYRPNGMLSRPKKRWIEKSTFCGGYLILINAELHALYTSPDIIRNIKSRRLRWAGHVARMGESRNAYRVLVGKPEGKKPLGRPRRRWEDNIKMDLREVGYDGRDWINLAQDRDQWRAYVRTAMNLRVP
ncbi:hypothetical protein ANN_25824 [Periplaneta americana]|uniref:Endonuclease-reverse transcriptase n=1 Tax=Periplaneta americana TaxID=6978 RepID=A0ABQ8S485_PERAM|nr:hypothetical protein ANN_25824 [Periplaneta americana]